MTTVCETPAGYAPAIDLLSGRTVLVTGADDEPGAGIAEACAAHGATVILLGRPGKKLEALYDRIDARHAQPALLPFDYGRVGADAFDELGDLLQEEFGRLDGLVHAAIDFGVLCPLPQYDPATWGQVMQHNFNAPYLLTRVCWPLLKRSDDAAVVFSTHATGRAGRPYWGAYGVSCAAIENLSQTWAAEVAGNAPVRFNTLDPGDIRIAARARVYPGEDPLALPEPASVAPAYVYLLGADSHGRSGEAWIVGTR